MIAPAVNRLFSAMRMDILMQWRTQLYTVGIVAGILVAAVIGYLTPAAQLGAIVPTLMLLAVGGTTMVYIGALIIFEKDEGTLRALIVSPLTKTQYLWSKILTLTLLATFESAIMVGGGMALIAFQESVNWPNVPLLLLGIIGIGFMYTLMGMILVVRYGRITDFLVPMAGYAALLQLPFLYFINWVTSPLLLLIPTSAPTMIMRGAFVPLETWQWVYGLVGTAAWLLLFTWWAYRAFDYYIIRQGR